MSKHWQRENSIRADYGEGRVRAPRLRWHYFTLLCGSAVTGAAIGLAQSAMTDEANAMAYGASESPKVDVAATPLTPDDLT
jgi:hypothetical protein